MGDLNLTVEPEVVKAVQKEIAAIGAATKTNFEELRRNYESLKSLVNETEGKFDGLVKSQITKLTEDITTRQVAIDNQVANMTKSVDEKLNDLATKRIDALETMVSRHKGSNGAQMSDQDMAKEYKDAIDFSFANMAVAVGKGDATNPNDPLQVGVHWSKVQDFKPDVDAYRGYCRSFSNFIRRRDKMPVPVEEQKALSVSIDPDGGYTVTPTISNMIVQRLYESDPMRQICSVETISTNAIEWMVDYDQAGAGWEGETTAGAETTTPQIYKKRIPVHVMYAKPRATQTLLEDSAINVESWLGAHAARRFMRLEGAAYVSGDGVGKPRGFLTYPTYTTAGVDEWGKIEQTNMGAAATLTADGFINVKYSLIEQYLQRATWLMNRLTVSAAMLLKNGQGDYIWKPGLKEDTGSTLLGLPVRMSTTMPTVAANALSVAIADWQESYMIVDRLGITIQRDPFTVKPYIEFYTRKRVGGDVINYQAIKLGVIHV